MEITFWGATEDVTGSMTFLRNDASLIMVDCGLAQGLPEVEALNKHPLPVDPKDITDVIITHAHLDHSGYLPRLVGQGFRGAIHCTVPTAKLMEIILLDSARLMDEEGLYTEKDVRRTLELVRRHAWGERIPLGNAQLSFLPAGHILGAASVQLTVNGKRLLFSGDLGRQDDPLLPAPPPAPAVDAIIMESTYGGKNRSGDIHKELHTFLETISREARVGIIASFAVARGQNILSLIHEYCQRHPETKFRLAVDSPMMKEASLVYQQYAHLTKVGSRLGDVLKEVDTIDFKGEWESLRKKGGPLIVVSSSGMLTGGRILRHLLNWSSDDKAILFLPGYQGPGTPGRALLEGKRELAGGKGGRFTWTGEVWGSEAFSSHAEQSELIAWAKTNNPKTPIYLLHGETTAKEALKAKLEEGGSPVEIPRRGLSRKLFL